MVVQVKALSIPIGLTSSFLGFIQLGLVDIFFVTKGTASLGFYAPTLTLVHLSVRLSVHTYRYLSGFAIYITVGNSKFPLMLFIPFATFSLSWLKEQ